MAYDYTKRNSEMDKRIEELLKKGQAAQPAPQKTVQQAAQTVQKQSYDYSRRNDAMDKRIEELLQKGQSAANSQQNAQAAAQPVQQTQSNSSTVGQPGSLERAKDLLKKAGYTVPEAPTQKGYSTLSQELLAEEPEQGTQEWAA